MDLSEQTNRRKPIVVIFVGMAGSGKTTLISRLRGHLPLCKRRGLILNLDPAAVVLPLNSSYDIMDISNIVQYREVLEHFNVGHDAGVLLSLDLVALEFGKVISIIEKKADMFDHILVDTPGRMEMFNLSTAGALIVEAFASKFPTVIAYVIDTPGCSSPNFPLGTVLQACDVHHKTRLCPVLTFNKIDAAKDEYVMQWIEVRDKLEKAVRYLCSSSLTQFVGVSLGEFGQNMKSVGVSATTCEGIDAILMAIEASAKDYDMRTCKARIDEKGAWKQHLDKEKGTEILGDNPQIAVKKRCTEKCRGQPGVLFAADLKDERAWTDTTMHKNDDNEKLSLVGLGSRRT